MYLQPLHENDSSTPKPSPDNGRLFTHVTINPHKSLQNTTTHHSFPIDFFDIRWLRAVVLFWWAHKNFIIPPVLWDASTQFDCFALHRYALLLWCDAQKDNNNDNNNFMNWNNIYVGVFFHFSVLVSCHCLLSSMKLTWFLGDMLLLAAECVYILRLFRLIIP